MLQVGDFVIDKTNDNASSNNEKAHGNQPYAKPSTSGLQVIGKDSMAHDTAAGRVYQGCCAPGKISECFPLEKLWKNQKKCLFSLGNVFFFVKSVFYCFSVSSR